MMRYMDPYIRFRIQDRRVKDSGLSVRISEAYEAAILLRTAFPGPPVAQAFHPQSEDP